MSPPYYHSGNNVDKLRIVYANELFEIKYIKNGVFEL